MTTETQLTRAPHVLPTIRQRVSTDVPDPTAELATAFCERYDSLDGEALSRAPTCIAAGALYLAALLTDTPLTQTAVADAAEVSALSTRQAYQELACRAGVATEDEACFTFREIHEYPAWVRRYLEGVGGDQW